MLFCFIYFFVFVIGGSSSPKIQINPTTNMSGLKIGTIKTEDQPSQKRKRDDDEDYDAC